MDELFEVAAAMLVLGAFAGAQLGRMAPRSASYLWLNFLGTGALAGFAWLDRSWGFLLLEGVWCLISGMALLAVLRGRGSGLRGAHA
ncbi:MAG: CBU_0592 family membrane protein [Sporichthyaceae bacterium]